MNEAFLCARWTTEGIGVFLKVDADDSAAATALRDDIRDWLNQRFDTVEPLLDPE